MFSPRSSVFSKFSSRTSTNKGETVQASVLTADTLREELQVFMKDSLEPTLNKLFKHVNPLRFAETPSSPVAVWQSGSSKLAGSKDSPKESGAERRTGSKSSTTESGAERRARFRASRKKQGGSKGSTMTFNTMDVDDAPLRRRFLPFHKFKFNMQRNSAFMFGASSPTDDNNDRPKKLNRSQSSIQHRLDRSHSSIEETVSPTFETDVLLLPEDIAREESGPPQPRASSSQLLLGRHDATSFFDNGVDYDRRDSREVLAQPFNLHQHLRPWIQKLVRRKRFDGFCAVLIFLNALVIGIETDLQAWSLQRERKSSIAEDYDLNLPFAILSVLDALFCIAFTLELVLRLYADGCREFFGSSMRWWNVFDFAVCTSQILETFSHVCHSSAGFRLSFKSSLFRILRLLRLVRILRVFRIMRMVRLLEMFRTIMASIVSSLLSLAGTVWLLLLFLYGVSIFVTQIVVDAGRTPHAEDMLYFYGRLGRTYLTMFESIFGGLEWDVPASVLVSDISPLLGVLYPIFVAFCTLTILNMATGVFVDNAMRKAQEDNDTNTAVHISDLFFDPNDPELAGASTITYEQFCSKISTPTMQQFFRDLNVDPSAAKSLYKLLDVDENGNVAAEDIISGCMRIRGNAKALELHILLHETGHMYEKILSFQIWVEASISKMCETLNIDLEAVDGEDE